MHQSAPVNSQKVTSKTTGGLKREAPGSGRGHAAPLLHSITAPAHDYSKIPIYAAAPVQLQAKRIMDTHDDMFEKEADHAADQVMRRPGAAPAYQQLREPLHPTAGASGMQGRERVPEMVHDVLNAPGQLLNAAARDLMEPQFGHNFSNVRVHTDAKAGTSAEAVHALAYTVGQNIVFAPGQFNQHSSGGQRLLAHELTHVVQQSGNNAPLQTNDGQPVNDLQNGSPSAVDAVPVQVKHFKGAGLAKKPNFSEDLSKLDIGALGLKSASKMKWFNVHLTSDPDYTDELNAAVDIFVETTARTGTPANTTDIEAFKSYIVKSSPRSEFELLVRTGKYSTYKPVVKAGEIVGYSRSSSGYSEVVDIDGKIVWSDEIPLETPLIDPIDLIPFELLGSLAVKAGTIGLRSALKIGAKVIAKDVGKVVVEEGVNVGTKKLVPAVAKAGAKELEGQVVGQGVKAVEGKGAAAAGKAAVGDAAKAATGDLSKTALDALVQVFRKGEKFKSVGAVSLKRLRNVLGRAGVSPSGYKLVKVSKEVAKAMEKEVGADIWGWISRTGTEVAVDSKGRPIINFTPRALASLEEAVKTFGHEAKHIKDFAAGLAESSEALAERAGEKLWLVVMESL